MNEVSTYLLSRLPELLLSERIGSLIEIDPKEDW